VRIVMLGDTGAGKTTYMALMYQFMDKGHRGFRIRTDDERHHKELLHDAAEIRKQAASVREGYEVSSDKARFTAVAITCGPQPKGEHVPVLWCLGHHIADEVARLKAEIEDTKAEAERARRNSSIANSLFSWWNDVESESERHYRLLGEAKERLEEMRPLEGPARALTRRPVKEQRRHMPPTGAEPERGAWWSRPAGSAR